jgi:hypothetical protein
MWTSRHGDCGSTPRDGRDWESSFDAHLKLGCMMNVSCLTRMLSIYPFSHLSILRLSILTFIHSHVYPFSGLSILTFIHTFTQSLFRHSRGQEASNEKYRQGCKWEVAISLHLPILRAACSFPEGHFSQRSTVELSQTQQITDGL